MRQLIPLVLAYAFAGGIIAAVVLVAIASPEPERSPARNEPPNPATDIFLETVPAIPDR